MRHWSRSQSKVLNCWKNRIAAGREVERFCVSRFECKMDDNAAWFEIGQLMLRKADGLTSINLRFANGLTLSLRSSSAGVKCAPQRMRRLVTVRVWSISHPICLISAVSRKISPTALRRSPSR
jgi:hypothetical protein